MAVVTICSDFGAQENKSVTFSPSISHKVMVLNSMILVFWMLSFKPAFFHSHHLPSSRGCFSSSSLSAIRVKQVKAVYCHPAYLNYMQSTWCGMRVWMKLKMESRLTGEISIISDNADHTFQLKYIKILD